MHEGKESRYDVLLELRTTRALYEEEQSELGTENKKLEDDLTIKAESEERSEKLNSILGSIGGANTAQLLDFLSKELTRLQDERRLHALSLLAERQRRMREAEESGLRQLEERRRREEEEIFRQVLQVHQESLDVYLEEVILTSVHQAADNEARREIQALAQKINNAAYEFENRQAEFETEEMVAELVHSFLLPEVQKLTVRERVRRKQQVALLAAHQFIYEDSVAEAKALSQQKQVVARPEPQITEPEFELPSVPGWHDSDALENWESAAQSSEQKEWHETDSFGSEPSPNDSHTDLETRSYFMAYVSRSDSHSRPSRAERYSRDSWDSTESTD